MIKNILRYCLPGCLLIFAIFSCEKIVYTNDDTDPVFVVQPSAVGISDTSATLYWETDEACHTEIHYGITTDYDSVVIETENRQLHTVTLTDLLPKMTYYCQVKVWDFADNGPVESGQFTFTTLPNEFSYLREAWEAYSAQNYTEAASLIDDALAINAHNPEIIASSGWIYLRTDQTAEARQAIETAYQLSPYMPLALAAKALLAQMDGQPEDVITYCQIILNREPEWEYVLNPSLNIKLVRLLQAEAYVQTNQTTNAQTQLDLAWPDNGLDPNIPDTWVINGETYVDYTLALLAAIHYAISQL